MSMYIPSRLLAIMLVCIIIAGCALNKGTGPEPTPKIAGFMCLPIPSEFMEAGSIFDVDADGTPTRIGRVVDDEIKVKTSSNVGFPTYTSDWTLKVGLFLSTLEKLTTSTGWSVNVSADASKLVSISTSYKDLSLQIIEGQPEYAAMRWFKKKGYRVESGTRYFFVREAIQAKEINYEIKRDDLAKMGGEGKIKEMVEGKLAVFEIKNNDSYILNAKFSSPVNVCIKPKELVAKGLSASGDQFLSFVDVSQPIAITGSR